ncbi:MAG TPA: ribonuclease P protein component [Patescibacteria group bacterium]|nr:ribonuclease P protein component [Patescibacteria group bacterium]
MFGRSSRIRLSRDYERLFQYGRSFHTPYLTLKTVQNQQDLNRFGIVVSNKVDKRAVVRNKMKRRLRAAARKYEPAFTKRGVDCAFFAKKEVLTLSSEELSENVETLLKKAKLL